MNEHDIMKALDGVEEDLVSVYTEFKPRKGFNVRTVIQAAAIIAVVLAIPVGAYAYTHLIHRDSVEMYLENTDKIEASGNVENQVMENEHIRITLDTVLSDGYTAMAVITLDALDNQGRNYIKYHPSIMLKRTDTGEAVFPSGSGGMDNWTEQLKNDTIKYFHTIDLLDKDISCDYEMIFYSNGLFSVEDWEKSSGQTIRLDENMIPVNNPLGYDFVAKVNFAKNVDTITLKGTNGKELTLSQFELISEHWNIWDEQPETLVLIRNDETTEKTDQAKMKGTDSDEYSTLFFGKFIELDEYKGIELNGVKYLK